MENKPTQEQLLKAQQNFMRIAQHIKNNPKIKKRINEIFYDKMKKIKKKDFDIDKLVIESSQEALKEFPEVYKLVEK